MTTSKVLSVLPLACVEHTRRQFPWDHTSCELRWTWKAEGQINRKIRSFCGQTALSLVHQSCLNLFDIHRHLSLLHVAQHPQHNMQAARAAFPTLCAASVCRKTCLPRPNVQQCALRDLSPVWPHGASHCLIDTYNSIWPVWLSI